MIFIFNFWKVNLVFWVWDDDVVRFWRRWPALQLLGDEKIRKKNGAHKQRSLFSKNFASKYSRHVVLCKNKQFKQQKNKKQDVFDKCAFNFVVWNSSTCIPNIEEKKTEHTNISHSAQTTLHQNIHVMLSYAIIAKNNQTKK